MSGRLTPDALGFGQLFWLIREAAVVVELESGKIVLWNPAADRLFGYSAREAVGLSVEVLMPDSFLPRFREGLERLRSQVPGTPDTSLNAVELPALRKGGAELIVECSLSRVERSAVGGSFVVALIRDVTGRRRAEREHEELLARERAERARTEALAELAQVGASIRDVERGIALITQRTCAITGADFAALALLDQDGCATWHGMHGNQTQLWRSQRLETGRGPVGRALSTGGTVTSERFGVDGWSDPTETPTLCAEQARAVIATPLHSRAHMLGALVVGWRSQRASIGEHVQLIEALAGYASIVVDNARAHAEAERLAREAQSRAEQLAASEALLAEREALLREIVDAVPVCVKLLNAEGLVTLINRAGLEMLGIGKPDAVIGTSLEGFIVPEEREEFRTVIRDVFEERRASLEFRIDAAAGARRWLEMQAVPLRDSAGTVFAALSITRDVTEQRRAREELEYLALHDALTGLPNRSLFQDRLERALASARRDGSDVALLLLDLDHLKAINDSNGHHAGDRALQEIGRRMSSLLRSSDTGARLGGDEFGMVLPGTGREGAEVVASRLCELMSEPWRLDGLDCSMTVSIGVARFDRDGDRADQLLRRADDAMYAAKRRGGGAWVFGG